jgi:uncharacterized protein YceH (UPF0502 family)
MLMDLPLSQAEARVLGCLIEKELTTPEYYPLTLNALTNACNQKSNRDPVTALEEADVVRALDALRERGLAEKIYKAGSRTPKYEHYARKRLEIDEAEVAVMAELLLRGPQTVGELRSRATRMHPFGTMQKVQGVLDALAARQEPLVRQLPRQPGRKEPRYAHLLAGEPDIAPEEPALRQEEATLRVRAEDDRLARLEAEVAGLKDALAALRRDFDALRAELE